MKNSLSEAIQAIPPLAVVFEREYYLFDALEEILIEIEQRINILVEGLQRIRTVAVNVSPYFSNIAHETLEKAGVK